MLAQHFANTKKKELVGNYDNAGRQWLAAKQPRKVQGHDFPSPAVPRAYPYGIYDLGRNAGFVNVGTDHDTGAFAVASIRGWWRSEGRRIYPDATTMLITADAGGSNGWRLRLWKLELQKFADQTGLYIFGLPLSSRHQLNGTRSNTGCFPLSRQIGAGSHCETAKRSSISLPRQPRRRD